MAANWEELEQKYSGGAVSAGPANDPWSALEQKYGVPAAPEKADRGNSPARTEEKEVSLLDRVRAGAAGINKGFFSDLVGLPVDTAANVLDLGKAAIGYTTSKVSGKAPPEWTAPYDRATVPGSAEWIAKQINRGSNAVGLGSPIDNPNPQDPASRIAYTGGRVGGASILPNPNASIGGAQQLKNIGMGELGGLLSGLTGEVAPEWAGVAGMVPQTAIAAGSAALKHGVRGGEAGRQNMEQRMQDFKNAGVEEPSAGLASGNKFVMGLENLLSQTPGSSGLFDSAKQKMVDGMRGRTHGIRDDISPAYGPVEAGAAVQRDLKGAFKDRIGSTYSRLNDRVEAAVGPDVPVPVSETIARSGQLTTPIKGAESTSSLLIQPRIKGINEALTADAGGKPAQVLNSVILGWDGKPAAQTVIPAVPAQGVPFSALKDLRTKIGKESQSNAIMGTPEQAEFKQLYGAMSQDMKSAVALADLKSGKMPAAGGSATTALNRANTYYSRGMERADDLGPLANRSTPEGAFNAISNSLAAGPTLYQKLRGAVTPETRQKVVATVVDEMGTATPGRQNAAGDAWSPQTFLTNFNRLDGQTRTELFKRLPGGVNHGKALDDIAKAAEMISEGSKVWANPSGTAPAMTARGTVYALTAGAFFQPLYAASTAAGLVGLNQVSQRLLLNPKFAHWLANAPKVPPAQAKAYAQRLMMNARMTNDKQFQADVNDYMLSVQEAFKEAE